MATTIAAIAKEAFDAVAAEVTDAIKSATVRRVTLGAYNVSTGSYAETNSDTACRAVLDTIKPVEDVFPNYTAGPKDQLWLIEGATSVEENDQFIVGGSTYEVMKVQDLLGAGALFYAVVN